MNEVERDGLRPILNAAKQAVGEEAVVEYPGYVWVEWDDLMRFVEAFSDRKIEGDG